ncbi:MAG: aminotransferase class III-fold pyridoxal phosphate-dependent enzyme [Deltaproteobacteria bacterium]|nr:aminotransferase class III-fold pyridoxal phosphate-dependent enzyme [Deltaproteobacteria bacterium]
MYTWAAGNAVSPLPVARAEGVYLYTPEGQRILDFNSQLMSVLIGHAHPKVMAAMKRQIEELIFVYPQTATQVRARLGKLLAEVVPGMQSFFFTLGGAEANENAVKMARLFTGRFKVMARYRSYHGGTNLTMQLTGDPRRWPSEPGSPGIVHVMDPKPYDFSFGKTEEERTANHLQYLEEVIQYEGPHTIAAFITETVTGTNGVEVPPKGWFKGLRALLDKYGILLICDEVMAGMGRTGKMLAYEHFEVVPDMVALAKGLTSSYFPLGAVGMTARIHEHFQKNVFWGGLTYNSHPVGLATAEAVIRVMLDEGMIENAARMEKVMRAEMDRLQKKHVSVADGRCIGLFGMMDIRKNSKGELIAPYNGTHPAMTKLAAFFREKGLFTFLRWSSFTCNPPLCITEEQLKEGFNIIDQGLDITDAAFEG